MYSPSYTHALTYLGNRPPSTLHPDDEARLTIHGDRDLLLEGLLQTYILPPLVKMGLLKVVKPKQAGFNHISKFHDETYLNCVKNGAKWLSEEMGKRRKEWEEAQGDDEEQGGDEVSEARGGGRLAEE